MKTDHMTSDHIRSGKRDESKRVRDDDGGKEDELAVTASGGSIINFITNYGSVFFSDCLFEYNDIPLIFGSGFVFFFRLFSFFSFTATHNSFIAMMTMI